MELPRPASWRAFAGGRYRPFHAIALGQSFASSFASDALFVPLLLRLGAPAWFVILVGSTPIAGSMLLAFLPQMLRRAHGDLRRLTRFFCLFELRGFVHASVVAATAAGALAPSTAVVLVALTVAIGQTGGLLSSSNIGLWTSVVLPEQERRLVAPRMGAFMMALCTMLLLPTGLGLDGATRAIGLWAYAALFALGGLVPIATNVALTKLPRPGRVLVAERPAPKGDDDLPGEDVAPKRPFPAGYRRFVRATTIAAFGQGVLPYLQLYAISVLGQSAGFAVLMSAVACAGSLAGGLLAGSFLFGGSASRVLRVSFVARAVAAGMCAAALPGNPAAPFMLLAGAALFNAGGNAGVLAMNERLYRLVPLDDRVRCQGIFVASTSAAAASGAIVCAIALSLAATPAYLPYLALYAMSGLSRSAAAIDTEVSASWRSPAGLPIRPDVPSVEREGPARAPAHRVA